MNGYVIRALVALVFAALLWAQGRAAGGRPHRRRAFELAAGGMLAFAGYNGALVAGAGASSIQVAVLLVGGVLLVLAAAELARSFFAGEMRDQGDRVAKAAQEYRERRAPNDKR
jgi:hypothetical protein